MNSDDVLNQILDTQALRQQYHQSAAFHYGVDQLVAMLPAFVAGISALSVGIDEERQQAIADAARAFTPHTVTLTPEQATALGFRDKDEGHP